MAAPRLRAARVVAAWAMLAAAPAAAAPAAHEDPRGFDVATLFRLSTHEGERLERADVAGKPVILFFGYTHCSEVCPTTMIEMTGHLQALGEDADRIEVLFVTVDPQRDTVEALNLFLSNFDKRITGLTGEIQDVKAVAKAFGTSLVQGDQASGSYAVDHSASTFLIDRYGLLARTVPFGDTEQLANYTKRLLAQ